MNEPTEQESKLLTNIDRLMKAIGAEPGTCRACGRVIWWVKHANGKRAPYTTEGLNHFADCPNANEFRKPKGG